MQYAALAAVLGIVRVFQKSLATGSHAEYKMLARGGSYVFGRLHITGYACRYSCRPRHHGGSPCVYGNPFSSGYTCCYGDACPTAYRNATSTCDPNRDAWHNFDAHRRIR